MFTVWHRLNSMMNIIYVEYELKPSNVTYVTLTYIYNCCQILQLCSMLTNMVFLRNQWPLSWLKNSLLVWNLKILQCIHKNLSPDPMPIQLNSFLTFLAYFFKINFNIIFISTSWTLKQFPPLKHSC